MSAHQGTLHGGVASTMTAVISLFWIPVLRKLTKSIIRNCYGCKRFRATHYPNPKPELLPRDRTEQALSFGIVGTDYAGSFYYRSKGKKYLKAYISSFSCSVSRAVHLELVSNLTTDQFIKSFKKLISRRRKPNIIYSDNAKPLRQEQNGWTVLIEMRSSMIFWRRKGWSGNSTFQEHHGGEDSTNVL